jgi:hypothetical protein
MNFKVHDTMPACYLVTERSRWRGGENTKQHSERHEAGQESKVGAGRLQPRRNSHRAPRPANIAFEKC